MKTCECKCTGFVDNPQVKRGRANSYKKNLKENNGDKVSRKNHFFPNPKQDKTTE